MKMIKLRLKIWNTNKMDNLKIITNGQMKSNYNIKNSFNKGTEMMKKYKV